MLPVRGLSRISRIVNLSFKVTGLKEQSAEIRAIISSVQTLIHAIIMANMAWRGLQMAMAGNPLGWMLLAVTGLSGVAMIQGEGTNEFEEYRSRSAK